MTEGLINGKAYQAPHCNSEVLHAPGRCVYCDHFPERQMMREASGTPFTPDEANGWSGNTAAPAGVPHTHMGSTWIPEAETDVRCDATDLGYRCEGRVINGRTHYGYHHFGARSWPKDEDRVPAAPPRMRTKLGRAAWDALRGHGRSRTRDASR